MKIDFVSDVSCPWCAIGLNALEQALQRIGPGLQASVHFQPFELNPQMGPDGQDIVEHLTQKYGISAEQVAINAENIRQRGASVGFEFGPGKRSRTYNTFDAHRLLHWAGLQGAAPQRALKHALFKAYFTDGHNPGDHALLLRLAAEVGLDAGQARQVLDSDAHADDVRQAEAFYQSAGIHSVPAVVVNDRHLISGGQPAAVFEQALRRIAAEEPNEAGATAP